MAKKHVLNKTYLTLAKRYKKALVDSGYQVERLVVFGSRVKKTNHKDSDLDICVVATNFKNDLFDEVKQLSHIARGVDDRIEPHTMSPDDYNDPYDFLAYEIRETGVVV